MFPNEEFVIRNRYGKELVASLRSNKTGQFKLPASILLLCMKSVSLYPCCDLSFYIVLGI